MKHDKWVNKMKQVLSLYQKGKTAGTLSKLDKLIDETRRISEKTVAPWHEQQALALKSIVLQESGKIKDAAAAEKTLIELTQIQFAYWGRALANSLAMAASLNFEAGKNQQAAKLARDAIKYAKQFRETNSIISTAKAKLRNYEKRTNNRTKGKKHNKALNTGSQRSRRPVSRAITPKNDR